MRMVLTKEIIREEECCSANDIDKLIDESRNILLKLSSE